MEEDTVFDNILNAVDALSVEDQRDLIEILRRRLVENRRDQLADDIRSATGEFADSKCRTANPEDLTSEIST